MQLKHLYLLNKYINIYKAFKDFPSRWPKNIGAFFSSFCLQRNICLFFNLFFNKSLHSLVLQKYSCTTIEAWLTFAVLSIHNIEAYSIALANFGSTCVSKQLEAKSFLKFKFQVMDLMDFKMSTSTCICFCWYTTV